MQDFVLMNKPNHSEVFIRSRGDSYGRLTNVSLWPD